MFGLVVSNGSTARPPCAAGIPSCPPRRIRPASGISVITDMSSVRFSRWRRAGGTMFKSAEERAAERREREAEEAREQAAQAERARAAEEQRRREAFLATPVGAA